ncbi:unnamed protein product [Rotaria sordida]|uniref:Uncharacterized protein n=1 Tax=Rotaria sordida TaxID=392033 RepID=A0A814SSE2_9BILA|nr:unnamed protein product [Rotaria sordida]CAF1150354.1 unnamed protein product [Rotaria sordida]
MDSNKDKSVVKKNNTNIIPPSKGLSILQTCLSGIVMGFIAYSGSFSAVPIFFTVTALMFGTKSLITIMATAFGQLAAGYLHTHSSRTGIALSTKLFHGFYIAKPEMRNRRQHAESRWNSLKRFFILDPLNALVLNFMWETFTFYYLIHSELFIRYVESSTSNTIENEKRNETITSSSINETEPHLLLIHGITRYLAGCLSGMSTGMINHLWQRHLAQRNVPHAIFNMDKNKLKLRWNERKKILSPLNIENWIKASTMILGALFVIASNIPNRTGFHLLDTRQKKIITDILVIHGGWFFIRDCEMLLLKSSEKGPQISSTTIQSSLIIEENKILDDEQSKMLLPVIEIH